MRGGRDAKIMENKQNNLTNLNTPKTKYFNVSNYVYKFRYNLEDFTPARSLAFTNNITFSKAIGIGLNYLRTNPEAEKISIAKAKNYKNSENKAKEKITTIALSEKNYNYLMNKPKNEKYNTLIKASYYSAIIYNPKKDHSK